jgi:hypothetical protein
MTVGRRPNVRGKILLDGAMHEIDNELRSFEVASLLKLFYPGNDSDSMEPRTSTSGSLPRFTLTAVVAQIMQGFQGSVANDKGN